MHAFYENRKLKTTTILKIICFCHLLKLFLNLVDRVDQDQTAPVVRLHLWEQSDLGIHCLPLYLY